jgi:murein DD-endopeptidase MepM/ murein hydrolase activator NlpD
MAGLALTTSRSRKVFAIAGTALAIATLIAVWIQPALLRVPTLLSLLFEKTPTKLIVPVQHVAASDLADTWGAPRGVDRRHEGIDIFAPRGRPVISTTNGVVFKVGENSLGGNVVRVLGPGWRWHYYAHLDRFADIKPGSKVQPGTVLGYVGDTGNARGTPYHLHYGIYDFMGGARNPYPLLATDPPDPKSAKSEGSDAKKLKPTPRSNSKRLATQSKSTSRQSTSTRPTRVAGKRKGAGSSPRLRSNNL